MKKFGICMLVLTLSLLYVPSALALDEINISLDEPVINAYGTAVISGTLQDDQGGYVDHEWLTLKVTDGQVVRYIAQKRSNAYGSFAFGFDIANCSGSEAVDIAVTDKYGNAATQHMELTDAECSLEYISIKEIQAEPIIYDNTFVFIADKKNDITQLTAEFAVSAGSQVYVDNVRQVSGVSVNNFKKPLCYRVIAQNGEKRDYIVSVIDDSTGYVNTKVDYDSSVILINGAVPIKKGQISIITQNISANSYVDAAQITSNSDGTYEHRLNFKADESSQAVDYRVNAACGNSKMQSDFKLYSKNGIASLIREICSASNSEEFTELVMRYSDTLGLDTGVWYEYIKEIDRVDALRNRLSTKMQSEDVLTIEKFSRCFDEAIVLTVVQYSDDSKLLYELLRYYNNEFEFAIGGNSDYDNIKNKTAVWNKISKSSYGSLPIFKQALSDAVVTELFNEADRSNIGALMLRYANELGFDSYSNYSSSQKEYIQKYIINSTYSKAADISAAYKKAVAQFNEIKSDANKASSGSGGGGGGSGSTGTVSHAPFIAAEEKQNVDSYSSATNELTFKDLANVPWASEAIEELSKKGIVNGTDNGRFEPNRNITREEFVVMMIRAFALYDENASCIFTDMPDTHWAYQYIASAVACGLIQGTGEAMFGTGYMLTREDMSVIAYRFAKHTGKTLVPGDEVFADDEQIAEYAKTSVSAMKFGGIMDGTGDGLFSPKAPTTRAMAAKVIYSILKFD